MVMLPMTLDDPTSNRLSVYILQLVIAKTTNFMYRLNVK